MEKGEEIIRNEGRDDYIIIGVVVFMKRGEFVRVELWYDNGLGWFWYYRGEGGKEL